MTKKKRKPEKLPVIHKLVGFDDLADLCVLECSCGHSFSGASWESAGWSLDDHLLDVCPGSTNAYPGTFQEFLAPQLKKIYYEGGAKIPTNFPKLCYAPNLSY